MRTLGSASVVLAIAISAGLSGGAGIPCFDSVCAILDEVSGLISHGPDLLNPATQNPLSYPPSCGDAGDHSVQFLYVLPSDASSRLSEIAPRLRQLVNETNGIILGESLSENGTARLRFSCDEFGSVTLTEVHVQTNPATRSLFNDITSQLALLGFNDSRTRYAIFYDGENGGFSGQATLSQDDRLVPSNRALDTSGYAVLYLNFSAEALAHEIAHTLGAVAFSAPHSTGFAHCNDGLDVLCYADGGPWEDYSPAVCTDRPHFDCNHDDYFSLAPVAASYLATHWNLGSAYNLYVDFSDPPPVIWSLSCPIRVSSNTSTRCIANMTDERSIHKFTMDWGDGTVASFPGSDAVSDAVHEWGADGTYLVRLNASDGERWSSASRMVTVVCTLDSTHTLSAGNPAAGVDGLSEAHVTIPPDCADREIRFESNPSAVFDTCWQPENHPCTRVAGSAVVRIPAYESMLWITLRTPEPTTIHISTLG